MTVSIKATFALNISIEFRLATQADLPLLEWYGQYSHFRHLYQQTYEEQCTGSRLMLLADLNGFPVGQVFILLRIDMKDPIPKHRGYLYSLRVIDHMQGLGIGTRLVQVAEALMIREDCKSSIISVSKHNKRARRLYERLGYRVYSQSKGQWHYTNHLGEVVHVNDPSWMLEKPLKTN